MFLLIPFFHSQSRVSRTAIHSLVLFHTHTHSLTLSLILSLSLFLLCGFGQFSRSMFHSLCSASIEHCLSLSSSNLSALCLFRCLSSPVPCFPPLSYYATLAFKYVTAFFGKAFGVSMRSCVRLLPCTAALPSRSKVNRNHFCRRTTYILCFWRWCTVSFRGIITRMLRVPAASSLTSEES